MAGTIVRGGFNHGTLPKTVAVTQPVIEAPERAPAAIFTGISLASPRPTSAAINAGPTIRAKLGHGRSEPKVDDLFLKDGEAVTRIALCHDGAAKGVASPCPVKTGGIGVSARKDLDVSDSRWAPIRAIGILSRLATEPVKPVAEDCHRT